MIARFDSRTGRRWCVPRIAGLCAALAILAAGPSVAKKGEDPLLVEEGVLDHIALKTPELPEGLGVIMRRFSAEDADLGTGASKEKKHQARADAARFVQTEGPRILAESFVEHLSEAGAFAYVRESEEEAPADALVIEGRFTRIDPGSKAKRYWVSFGAGKSGVEVEGVLKDPEGNVLAEFRHMKSSGIGLAGGDYVKFLSDDTRDVGRDLARFLERWAAGEDLHKD